MNFMLHVSPPPLTAAPTLQVVHADARRSALNQQPVSERLQPAVFLLSVAPRDAAAEAAAPLQGKPGGCEVYVLHLKKSQGSFPLQGAFTGPLQEEMS